MIKKAIKIFICVFIVFAVMLGANGSVVAIKPESAKLKVIDISKWNDSINWSKTSLAVDGVIARIGYRGSVYRDSIAEDDLFYTHFKNAQSYSVPFGVYFYSLAVTVEQAVEEAEWIIQTLKRYNCKPEMPIYIDMEDYIVQNETTNRKRTDIAKAFCQTLLDNGYYPGVYANKYWLSELLFANELSDCSIWVAQYASECSYSGSYDMWQYTETGTVNGITGNVDVNHCYRDYPTFIKKYGFNGHTGVEDYVPDKEIAADASKFGMYKITTSTLNVRSGPGTSYSSLGKIKSGSEVYVFGYDNGWGNIQYGNAQGWISLSYSEKTLDYNSTKTGIGFYSIITDTLNVRAGAGTSYSKVGKLYLGEQVYINSIKNGWGSYYYGDGSTGWVSLEYAHFVGTVNFLGNGAVGSMNHQMILKDESAELYKNSFTSGSKTFSGWSETKTGAVKYKDCSNVKMGDKNLVLYAVFTSDEMYKWNSGVTVKNGTVFISDFKIKQSDFASKYLTLYNGAKLTLQNPFAGVVGTGSVVNIADGAKSESFTVCILGDVNGDGLCDGLDLSLAVESISGNKKDLSQAQLTAIDLNSDSKRDSNDIALFKNKIF